MSHPPYVLIPPEDNIGDYHGLASEPHRYLAAAIADLLMGCEWELLDMLEGRAGRGWGMGKVTEAQLANLRSIREACAGGWVARGPIPIGVVPIHADEIDETRAHWGDR